MSKEHSEDILRDLLGEDAETEDDFEKEASADEDILDEETLEKVANWNIQMGRLRARAFAQQLRKEAGAFFTEVGLTPEAIQESLNKEAAAGALPSSYPHIDVLSQVLNFIFRKIHPHQMIENYKPGTSGTQGLNLDPDKQPLGKENTVIADHRRTDNITPPSNPFGLKKK